MSEGAEADRLRERIAEVVGDDGGCWRACSGCQEGVDGYVSERDYPYSATFKCQPGGGCHECGGIGVLWESGDYLRSFENYYDVLAPIAAEPARGDADRRDDQARWLVPRHADDGMMQAGLYHCSADMRWEDLFTAFHHMVDAAQLRDDVTAPKPNAGQAA